MISFKNKTLIRLTSGFQSVGGVRSVRLEASSICQLRCPICPTGTGENKSSVIGRGFLSFKHFKQFVDNSPQIKLIELSNYGEILLNPEFLKIIEYAYRKKVWLTALNGVNLNTASRQLLEGLVKYKVRALTLSIDGASPQSYEQYRIGGDFQRVISNLQIINHYKKKYRCRWPVLRWQFVVFDHNRHELKLARQMAKEMHAFFSQKKNWAETRQSDKDAENRMTDKKKVHSKQVLLLYCTQFWYQPQINWDGKLLGCCVNHFRDFGNVFSEGLENLIKSGNYQKTKNILLGLKTPSPNSPCYHCPVFKQIHS